MQPTTPTPSRPLNSKLLRFSTSLLVLFICFLSMNLFHQILQGLLSKGLGYKIYTTFTKVNLTPIETQYWSLLRVIFVHGGPMVAFFIMAIFLAIRLENNEYNFNRDESGSYDKKDLMQLFLFWSAVCAFNITITQILVMPLGIIDPARNQLFQDASVIALWFYMPPAAILAVSLLTLVVELILGFYFGRHFVDKLSYSRRKLSKPEGRLEMVLLLYVLPLLLLFPFAILLTYPHSPVLHLAQTANLLWLTLGIFMYFELRKANVSMVVGKDVARRKSTDLLIVLLLLLVVVKVILKY